MPQYKNGNYTVTMMSDGTKIRFTKDDEFKPAFSENTDCCITRKCKMGCKFCYEGCTQDMPHGDLFKYPFINNLHPYTEMAINGNDLDHPDLEKFLQHLKNQKVYANITVHQIQFLENFDKLKKWQDEKLVYGIGVSLYRATPELIEKLNMMNNTVLHTIVGILTEDDINILKNNGIKILILGYKDMQRGIDYKSNHATLIKKNTQYLYDHIDEMTKLFKVVSFDNLALTQLDIKRILSEQEWEEFYMGDDGGFTFYIDLVNGTFAKNSIAKDRYPIGDKSIDEMFSFIRTLNH